MISSAIATLSLMEEFDISTMAKTSAMESQLFTALIPEDLYIRTGPGSQLSASIIAH